MLVGKPSLRVWRWNGHSWKSLFVFSCVFLVGNMLQGQTLSVVWPEDVLDGSCEESIDLFQEQPQVEEGSSCSDVQATFLDEMLEADCEQETWVDRHWQVVGCDDTLMHVQRIRLVDQSPPRVVSDESYTGHFCAQTLEWLPNVQDNCDVTLSGEIDTSDTLALCAGVSSFVVSLNLADNCGNVLDTSYVVVLHEACDSIVFPVVGGCTDPLATNFSVAATCDDGTCLHANELCGEGTYFDMNSGVCLPSVNCASPWEYCGPLTVWDASLARCVPESISAACYFDANNSGMVDIGDLLSLLAAYGLSCDSNED